MSELFRSIEGELRYAAENGYGGDMPAMRNWVCGAKVDGDYAETTIAGVFRTGKEYAWFEGGCDTTGWDCQASFDWGVANTAEEARQFISEATRGDLVDAPTIDEAPALALVEMLDLISAATQRGADAEEIAELMAGYEALREAVINA